MWMYYASSTQVYPFQASMASAKGAKGTNFEAWGKGFGATVGHDQNEAPHFKDEQRIIWR
jgi:hypothetical protein